MLRQRLGIVLLGLCGCFVLVGCQDSSWPTRNARWSEEIKALTATRDDLRRDLDACRQDLVMRQEAIEQLRRELAQARQEKAEVQRELADRTQERDSHAAALTDLRQGLLSLIEKADAQLKKPEPPTMPDLRTVTWSF
ncbi:MAG TPA: hypothetical protein PKD86_17055 [Gemmatales bacterium]|nr:hypothetical protein [Gemmatales bacterium]HMP61054.1 hypothetical protein [Gemmatales bacterium]